MKTAGRIALFLFSATFFDYQFDSDLFFWVVRVVVVSIDLSAKIIGGIVSSTVSVGGIICIVVPIVLACIQELRERFARMYKEGK